jgi:uncharacterized beta-barrel protein YwiB (DUF1934 family)
MTKEVLVAITGLQFDMDSEESDITTITAGEYYKRNNSHYVLYDEVVEGTEGNTKNVVKFRDNMLELTKKGYINTHMIFEVDKKNLTNYSTPFGDILIGIDAKKVTLKEEENKITVNVDYTLEANYEFLAECKLTMEIAEKEHATLF